MDTVRGGDSTGVFVVPRSNITGMIPGWAKHTFGGHEFVKSKEFVNIFENGKAADYKFCVGHNRSATIGGVSVETAHPFQEGPITLVHNGTVNESIQDTREALGAKNDSHAICHLLGKYSVEDVISGLDGAFALVWYDNRDDSLNFVRNDKRPFHMAKSKTDDTIYFSSEAEMLMWLNNRLTLKLMDIVSLKPAHLLKFTGLGTGLLKPEVRALELHKPKSYVDYTPSDWNQGTSTFSAPTIPKASGFLLISPPHGDGSGKSGTGTPKVLRPYSTTMESAQTLGGTDRRSLPKGKQTIPHHLELDLFDLELCSEETAQFYPIQAEQLAWFKREPTYSVWGYLLSPNKRRVWARVDRVTEHTWDKASQRAWTVKPMGVVMLGWDSPCAICRLCTSVTPAGMEVKISTPVTMPPAKHGDIAPLAVAPATSEGSKRVRSQSTSPYPECETGEELEAAACLKDVEFPGPSHRMLSYDDWHSLTEGGCIGCSRVLTITHDGWSTSWVNGGNDACCADCVQKIASGELDPDLIEPMPYVPTNTSGRDQDD
jgi:hypothetical protein